MTYDKMGATGVPVILVSLGLIDLSVMVSLHRVHLTSLGSKTPLDHQWESLNHIFNNITVSEHRGYND